MEKGDLKNKAKSYAKNKVKKKVKGKVKRWIWALIAPIMIPWGCIVLIGLFAISALASFFISDDGNGTMSKKQSENLTRYIEEHVHTVDSKDYYSLDKQCETSQQIVENYVKFLILQKKVSKPITDSKLENLADEAISEITPSFKYEDGKITTVTKKKVEVKEDKDENEKDKEKDKDKEDKPKEKKYKIETETSTENITLLKHSTSVFGDITYSYKNETTTTKNGDTTITITAPVLSDKKIENKFSLIKKLLKRHNVNKKDYDMMTGAIAFSSEDKSSWDWIFKKQLPELTMSEGGFDGGYIGGDLKGISAELQSDFKYASELTGVPNWLLAGIAQQESTMNPNCSQAGGAAGIMQIQHYDFDGSDLFKYYLDSGMRQVFSKAGYTGSADQLWAKLVKDPKLQIITGAYEIRHYINYILWKEKKVTKLQYSSASNMKLLEWDKGDSDKDFKMTIMRSLASYNGGPAYHYNSADTYIYSVKVWEYAMAFKNSMSEPTGSGNANSNKVISIAKTFIGNSRYVYGRGRNTSDQKAHIFDCSSYVWYVYHKAGKDLGPMTSANTNYFLQTQLTRVGVKNMKPGDLVFFDTDGHNSHVGIYIGNNKFINAQSSGVKIASLDNPYWSKAFVGVVGRVK